MEIKNAKYNKSLYGDENVSINADIDGERWSVPLDPGNRFYAEILKQVEEGKITIEDAD